MMDNRNTFKINRRAAATGFLLNTLCVLVGLPFTLPVGFAQRSDSFEGGDPRWQLVESDCNAQLPQHEISLLQPHGGRTCELFEVACGNGRMALLAYPIEPAAVLNEFQPRVWTRCSSGRIQLGVRVIFPQAEHPVTLGRLNSILWGDSYQDTGQWQMLRVENMQKLLQSEIVSLRQQFGSALNLNGAYVDSLVLNAYTGPGRYRVQVDDLDLPGMIPLASLGIPPPANWRERWRWRHETPTESQRFWAAANRPPVWFQYHDESLGWLQSLGFTGLFLNRLPSERQLEQIHQASLGVISPPPPHALTIKPEVAPVLRGWLIGAALDGRQTELARQQATLVQKMPTNLQRPLVGEALEQFWQFTRIADEVIVPAPSPVSAGRIDEKLAWLSEQLQTTRHSGSGWVSIDAGLTPALVEQYRSVANVLAEDEREPVDPLRLRHQTTAAVIAGARGFLFRTFEPIEILGTAPGAHVAGIRWTMNDLSVWGPWIMAGQSTPPPKLNRNDYLAGNWTIVDSQLIIAQTSAAGSQHCIPATASQSLDCSLPSGAQVQQVFRITRGALERVELKTTSGTQSWTVERPAPIEIFVLSSNPNVLSFINRKLAASAAQNAADQLEITAYNLMLAAEVTDARFSMGSDAAIVQEARQAQLSQIAEAQRTLDGGWQALRGNNVREASALAFQASDATQAILYDAYQTALTNLASPQSSPMVLSPALLSYHWRLAEACERSQWRPLELPGADLTNLNALLDSGWTQQRRLEDEVDLRVEILPSGFERSGGLRMAAYQKQASNGPAVPGGYAGASLFVRSASVPVRSGQLIRVGATARVLRPPSGPESGLLVYDNQAGPSLGQLIRGQAGEQVEVELYRFCVSDGEFRLLAECRGECDIVLESISASVIEPATNRRSYPTAPAGSLPITIIGEAVEQP